MSEGWFARAGVWGSFPKTSAGEDWPSLVRPRPRSCWGVSNGCLCLTTLTQIPTEAQTPKAWQNREELPSGWGDSLQNHCHHRKRVWRDNKTPTEPRPDTRALPGDRRVAPAGCPGDTGIRLPQSGSCCSLCNPQTTFALQSLLHKEQAAASARHPTGQEPQNRVSALPAHRSCWDSKLPLQPRKADRSRTCWCGEKAMAGVECSDFRAAPGQPSLPQAPT